jgi:beta-lactamase class A
MIRRFYSRWLIFCVVSLVVSQLLMGCSSMEKHPLETQSNSVIPSVPEPTSLLREAFDQPGDEVTPVPVQTVQMTSPADPSPVAASGSLLEEAAASMVSDTSLGVSQVLARFGEMNPQSADGPLAAAILLDAGELQAAVNPRSFWLLNPLKDTIRLERYLPHEDFIWTRYSVPARQVDLSKSLIQPGDLVYLIPADDRLVGSYYAVTRMDPDGRAYTVTILPGDESGTYRIGEALLFDPAALEDGLLRKAPLALNGKGLLVWHKRSYADQSEYETQLNRVINRGGKWSVLVREIGGETIFERDGSAILHPASIIKVPLGMLVLHSLTIDAQDLEEGLAKAPPGAGRTYEQLIHAMLALSEETATDILEHDLVQRMGSSWIRSTLEGWGAVQTTLEPRRSTAKDIERLFIGLFTDQYLGKTTSRFMLDALGEVTGGDTVRLWKLQAVLPPGAVIYNKRGSLTNPMVVADAGILSMPNGNAYFICMVGNPDDWTTFEELDQIIGDFSLAWYQIQLVEGFGP